MKRFRFSMQKILDLRTFEQKNAEIELGKALAAETAIQRKIESLSQGAAAAAVAANGSVDFEYIRSTSSYIVLLKSQIYEQTVRLAEAKVVSEQKRSVLVKAIEKKKVLEKLRDKKLEAYKKAMLKAEETALDDVVTGRY